MAEKKPNQTLLFIKPKQVEEPPIPIQEVVKDPIADAPLEKPVVPKPLKKSASSSNQKEDPPRETREISLDEHDDGDDRKPIFQAVGIIPGQVRFDDLGKGTVTISDLEYPLFYNSKHRYAYAALQKEVKANGEKLLRLIVYPRVTHFPKREQPYRMSFQLVGFDSGRFPAGVASELKDFEFKLSGLWQFIPVCQTPCVSIFRNFNLERLDYIKQAEPEKKVRFMKASHVPLLWKDAPVRPFRFNPKLDKEQQGHSSFVEVKAKFLPGPDVFGFSELLSEPREKAPNFLKAGKADKALALKNKIIQQKSLMNMPKKKV